MKTPVIVGRRDDRRDDETKLADGTHLLELKRAVVDRYVALEGGSTVNPVTLVLAPNIAKAEGVGAFIDRDSFAGGRYRGKILTVHSDQGEGALADLDKVEDPESPVRVIVAVGMLKEGWDVRNVYVIVSLRASVSEILTEQTLGRGLRLPFGAYIGIEMLDTLEVVAHEQYEKLLKKAEVLREEFVNHRTLLLRHQEAGRVLPERREIAVEVPLRVDVASTGAVTAGASDDARRCGEIVIGAVKERRAHAERQVEAAARVIRPSVGAPVLRIPVVKMTPLGAAFALADVAPAVFRELGQRHSADPDSELLRTVLSAETGGGGGTPWTRLVTRPAEDRVDSVMEESLLRLRMRLADAPEVPARASELRFLNPLIDAYVEGLGPRAEVVLAAYLDRAVLSFRHAPARAQRDFEARPQYDDVVGFKELPLGISTTPTSCSP